MKTVLLHMWKEPMSDYLVLNYILKFISFGLLIMAVSGIGKMIFEIVTNPSQFNNVTFGLIDYI